MEKETREKTHIEKLPDGRELHLERLPDGTELHFKVYTSIKNAHAIERFCPYCGYESKARGEDFYESIEGEEWPYCLACPHCGLPVAEDYAPDYRDFLRTREKGD